MSWERDNYVVGMRYLCRGNQIIMSWARDLMSWARDLMSWARDLMTWERDNYVVGTR